MTVVVINDFGYVDGGASQVAIATALTAKKMGQEVIYFTAVDPIDSRLLDTGIRVISTHQLEVLHYKNKIQGAIMGIWNIKAKYMLSELLDNLDPTHTIIHIHSWIKSLSPSIFAAIQQSGFKFVITAHDYFLACPNGGFYNYPHKRICRYKAMTGKCICTNCDRRNYAQKLYRALRQYVQNHILSKSVVNLIFISHYSESLLEKQISFHYNSFFLRNLVSPIKSADCENSKVSKDLYLYIGRVTPEKGADLFCEAMKRTKFKGVLIGDGESREQLQKQYASEANITFAGWKKHEEITEYLMRTKALIVPSRWHETAVLTIPEVQWNYDMPVLVGDQCAGSEFVEEGKNGFIFKSGNVSSLVQTIQKFEHLKSYHYCNDQKYVEMLNSQGTVLDVYTHILYGK